MVSYETIAGVPILGGAFIFLYRKFGNKIDRKECLRVHESLDKRLDLIHEDIKFIKGRMK